MQTQQTETLVLSRVLDASPEKVFKAWTDPSLVAKWFRPNERWLRCEPDITAVEGGNYILEMHHQDGDVYRIAGKVTEIVPNEKIAFTWMGPGDEGDDKHSLVTVSLKPVPKGTELTLVHSRLASVEAKNSVTDGWTGCLTMLEEFVKG